MRFSRHAHIGMLLRYRDDTINRQGELASAVAATAPTNGNEARRPAEPAPDHEAFHRELARFKRKYR